MATTVLNIKITEVENKMSNMSGLVTTTALNTKISKVKNEIRIHDKYITTLEFNKLTVENYTARLKWANWMTKTDFDKKLTRFNRKTTSNKTKYLEVQKKLRSPITIDYNFFLGRMYFTSNDESQNTLLLLFNTWLKKAKLLIMFLVGNQMEYKVLNISHYMLLSYIA